MRHFHLTLLRFMTVAVLTGLAAMTFAVVGFEPKEATAACAALSTSKGAVTQTFNAPVAATYTVWSRIKVPDTTNNSYYLEIDDTVCGVVVGDGGITANQWTWIKHRDGNTGSNITATLTAGNHTIRMIGRETGVDLDRIIMTTDACVPTGTGDNCASQNVDTTPPTVSFTQPANNATVSGLVDFAVDATDNVGISKVEFLVDGQVAHTETVAPYEFLDWNSATVANGSHTVTAKAYDAAGNTASATRTLTINNGGTNPPTPNPSTGMVNYLSGVAANKCLDAANAAAANGTKVQLYACSNGNSQKWQYQSSDQSIRFNGTNYCLDITGGSTAIEAKVQLYTCANSDGQKWTVNADNTIRNPKTGYCLDVKASAPDNGTQIQTYTCNGTNAQKWTTKALSVPEDINEDGVVNLLDFSLLSSKFNQSGAGVGRADINGDGTVNLLDFSLLAAKF